MQWEDHTDRRSPLLLVYGLVAGGAMIGLVLLISFVHQNAGAMFTAQAAEIVLVTTGVGIAVAYFAGRRASTGLGRRPRDPRSRRVTRGRLNKGCAAPPRGAHPRRRIHDFSGRGLAGGRVVDLR